MERAEGLLGGKFLFKRQNDRTIDKTKVVCSICQAEFSYHRSSSSLSYHLNAKVAGDCRPINIVEDGGLTEVIRIASGDNSYDLLSRGTAVSRIHSLYDGERAR